MLFFFFGPSSLTVVVAHPDQRPANRTASMLEWNNRYHRTYSHNIWFKRRRKNKSGVYL